MSSLYFDCTRGAAGDMISASLFNLLPNSEENLQGLNAMGIPGVHFVPELRESHGISGLGMRVEIYGEEEGGLEESAPSHRSLHVHRNMKDIREIVSGLHIRDAIKSDVLSVYGIIAEAESIAHQQSVEEVHFHEVGALDAIADVAAASYLIDLLSPERITASVIGLGNGSVLCAHGLLPVPAPATALILKGLPTENGEMDKEACTPTGAAILKYFVDSFAEEKPDRTLDFGTGIGRRRFNVPSYFRTYLYA